MSEWWTYQPADLLLFNARAYYRMLEMHNADWWPLGLAGAASGLVMLVLLLRGGANAGRVSSALLGAVWLLVAWAFMWRSFAVINWAAAYAAPVFAVQGLAIAAYGLGTGRLEPVASGIARIAGVSLFAAVVLLYPLIALAAGRPWLAGEAFGLTADPTAIATLAFLALARGGAWLMVVPVLWCALSAETLWLLESPEYFVPAGAALALVLLRLSRVWSR